MVNEGVFDRILRFIFGIGFFVIGFFYFESAWRYLFYILGLGLIITAITGYCGLYKILNISTIKKKKRRKKFIRAKEEMSL